MAFNLKTLALSTGSFDLQLKHPATGELLFEDDENTIPVIVTLYGTASKQWIDNSTKNQNAYIKRGKKLLSSEEVKASLIDTYVVCSLKSNLEYDGRVVDSEETFRALYSDPQFEWIKSQVDEGIGEVANFL